MTELWAIVIVISAAVLGAFGQLCFKIGSDKLVFKIKQLITNTFLMLGVVLYGIATVMFVIALKGGELSVLYPLIATSYIWTVILARKYLGENINIAKIIGILFIITGAIFIMQ